MTDHLNALRAVARDRCVPNASDKALSAAKDAGLIAFNSWPLGLWRLTPKGREALDEAEARQ